MGQISKMCQICNIVKISKIVQTSKNRLKFSKKKGSYFKMVLYFKKMGQISKSEVDEVFF